MADLDSFDSVIDFKRGGDFTYLTRNRFDSIDGRRLDLL